MSQLDIAITDRFDNRLGQFINYDLYDVDHRNQVHVQQHTDLRTFNQIGVQAQQRMFELDQFSMTECDALTVADLEAVFQAVEDENWVYDAPFPVFAGLVLFPGFALPTEPLLIPAGEPLLTVGPMDSRNHLKGLVKHCPVGTTSTSSMMPTHEGLREVDITTGYTNSDFLSVALPNFPLASINTASTFLDLTDDPAGDFTNTIASFAFSSSTTTLVTGDSEFRVPKSLWPSTIDYTKVTRVRFRITATAICTFKAMAIRVISQNWRYLPTDIDTLFGGLVPTVSLTGSLATPYEIDPVEPAFRATVPTSTADPTPVDSVVGLPFNTGSLTSANNWTNTSVIKLFMREITLDENQQLDLDGTTMDDLNHLTRHQPDFDRAKWAPRTQENLDTLDQEDLDQDTQFIMERVPDLISEAYVAIYLEWCALGARFTFANAEGTSITLYPFFGLEANSDYIIVVNLEDIGLRARIYPLEDLGTVDWSNLLFDTDTLTDDSFIHRRKGRIGWQVSLLDGDAKLDSLRTETLNFGEYRTHPYASRTPVDGASIQVQGSPDRELFDGLMPTAIWGLDTLAKVELDPTTPSGQGVKITADGTQPLQGLQTNLMQFDDFRHTELKVTLKLPGKLISDGKGLEMLLYGTNGSITPLPVPPINPDTWQTFYIDLDAIKDELQSGQYRLVMFQSLTTNAVWGLDSISIKVRALLWEGRGHPEDAWHIQDSDWVPFGHTVDLDDGGIVFADRGRGVQVRAKALMESATIRGIKTVPKYSELGRLIWDSPTLPSPPIPAFTYSGSGLTRTFNGATSTGTGLLTYIWTFGDGTFAYGPVVAHTYPNTGNYVATLVIFDSVGQQRSISHAVTV